MPEVVLAETDRVDWALKTFKRQMLKAGILRELRKRRHHVKRSDARRLKIKAARRMRDRARKNQRRDGSM
jgi:small subunit ribosomal protein S21